MRLRSKMKKLLLTTFIVPLLFSFSLAAQTEQNEKLDLLLEKLETDRTVGGSSDRSVMQPEGTGYKSFVQNELQNIFAQIDALTEQEREDIIFSEVNQKRIELATSLCTKDERACFLIDEYRSYTSQNDLPKSFEELQLFGQDIFSGYSNDFNFYDSLPIKDNYIVKIGDQLKITVYGGFQYENEHVVDMTGSLVIPDIGELQIAGLTFQEASSLLKQTISQAFAGSEALISLAQIRSKQIFILGNVKTPGTYALNAFGTALNGLISSGGLGANSSLRSIKIMRDGQAINTIDLYSLLIDGNVQSSDFILNDGDSVLVGGLQSSISIIGEVIRPAIYELADNDTLEDAIQFALGTTPFADSDNISIERLLPSGLRTVLNPTSPSKFLLKNGDRIVVNASVGQKINSVSLAGALRNTGEYSLQAAKNLGDIIKVERDLLNNTYTGYAILKRFNFTSKSFRLLSFNLSNQNEVNKVNLSSGDEVYVFSNADISYMQSQEVYEYLKRKLGTQSTSNINEIQDMSLLAAKDKDALLLASEQGNQSNVCLSALDVLTEKPISRMIEAKLKIFPSKYHTGGCTDLLKLNSELLPILLINSVPVSGNVRFPGLYPTSRDLNGLDLFNLAGGFLLSKLNVDPAFDVGIRARGFGTFAYQELSTLSNITMLSLRIDQGSFQEGYVKLAGEFNNPGIYPISKGTTLSELYDRAGGLTNQAFPLGGILTRESIQLIESEALARSKAELSEILASAAASGFLKQNSTDLVGLIALMTSISNAQPVGRLVTELNPSQFRKNPGFDIVLEDGDAIYIPEMQNTVTIVGQVLNPVTVPHKPGDTFNDYIKFAGGLKKDADKSKIYAVLPNGISNKKQSGFSLPLLPGIQLNKADILPGSTIIIPRQARPLDTLTLVETVTPILASLSITAASIAAISD